MRDHRRSTGDAHLHHSTPGHLPTSQHTKISHQHIPPTSQHAAFYNYSRTKVLARSAQGKEPPLLRHSRATRHCAPNCQQLPIPGHPGHRPALRIAKSLGVLTASLLGHQRMCQGRPATRPVALWRCGTVEWPGRDPPSSQGSAHAHRTPRTTRTHNCTRIARPRAPWDMLNLHGILGSHHARPCGHVYAA